MNKKTRLLIVIFLGMFGVHKFIDKNYKMGFIYLITFGLFGIGWIVDIIKELTKENVYNKTLMSKEELNKIKSNQLPVISTTNINLARDEICHYADVGYTFKDKTITTGYTGKNEGVSIKIAKGLTYRTGNSKGKAMRETLRTTYTGTLYITNKRVIYSSTNECFDKPLDKISSITEATDGIIIQIGTSSYSIILNTHTEFVKVFNMIKNSL